MGRVLDAGEAFAANGAFAVGGVFAAGSALGASGFGVNQPADAGALTTAKAAIRAMRASMNDLTTIRNV